MATVITEAGTTMMLPESFNSLESFRDWVHSDARPDRGQFTYIRGGFEADMSPERISGHNEIKAALYARIGHFVEEHQLGKFFPDGAMLINDDADLGCEPDMMFCTSETLRSGRVTYRAWHRDEEGDVELYGTPDMVAEVVSNSSVRKDTVELRQAYFKAGIAEYWLIDGRGEEIEFELLVRGETSFVGTTPDVDGYRYSPTFGHSYRFIREADPIVGWQCRLLARSEDAS